MSKRKPRVLYVLQRKDRTLNLGLVSESAGEARRWEDEIFTTIKFIEALPKSKRKVKK